jgi:hypothetical protein
MSIELDFFNEGRPAVTTTATELPAANEVPKVPDATSYEHIERWLMAVSRSRKDPDSPDEDWSLEDVGRLARLVADLRSDASRLNEFADEIDVILLDAIDCDRNRHFRSVA